MITKPTVQSMLFGGLIAAPHDSILELSSDPFPDFLAR